MEINNSVNVAKFQQKNAASGAKPESSEKPVISASTKDTVSISPEAAKLFDHGGGHPTRPTAKLFDHGGGHPTRPKL